MKKFLKQKKIFLDGEGNNWFNRNKKNQNKNKLLLNIVQKLIKKKQKKNLMFLEVGCSDGKFILNLKKKNKYCKFFGIDPSKKAIELLEKNKIKGFIGTADKLPFPKKSIDIILYGFCLYLCDPIDYNKIYSNAYRVLKEDGNLIIFDFFSKKLKIIPYKHDNRIRSFKRDFSKIFTKKNKFKCIDQTIFNYSKIFQVKKFIKNDLLSIFVLKKNKILS
jgi:ubiquinone/menaquinone biosynthesis C-methylase UbiE